jgi:ribulose-phosphate 3-epimerase
VTWNLGPCDSLLADVSLWSADLVNLQRDVERLSPYADSFHLDVADGHFAPDLLFFPDLIAALRPHTARPFHAHLMVARPSRFVERFAAAGADLITVHVEAGEAEARETLAGIRACGKAAGLALRLETPIAAAAPYVESLDAVLLLGTEVGVKGRSLAPGACARIAESAGLLQRAGRRSRTLIVADGGIRKETVPQLRAAGADAIVPGSLVFQAGDPAAVLQWIHAGGRPP